MNSGVAYAPKWVEAHFGADSLISYLAPFCFRVNVSIILISLNVMPFLRLTCIDI